jgi:hypothetical protein
MRKKREDRGRKEGGSKNWGGSERGKKGGERRDEKEDGKAREGEDSRAQVPF